jgi:site-specific DNA recombinase
MVIPARRQVGNNIKKAEKPKLRVAAYCRVSTDSDEQATSYEAQIEHYTEYISKNPDWVLAGIFADDGISGTNTKKRDEFNRMIDECHAGNIDMIITKSISRFARNTLDCLKFIRELKDINIPVYFEKESINTMDAKGEVLLTIMASLAQQESQSLSQNVKLGLQYRYQQGQVQVNHNRFIGYTKDADGHLIIDPEQAEIVKRIYREYLEGLSMDKIAAGLEADGILTGAGKAKWHTSTVSKILRNEKYIGDALLQKTYTTDFLTKKRIKNNGTVPQYYVESDHEAIIPKDIFLLVQEELARRRLVHTTENGKRRCYSCNHCFAQIVFCGDCGEFFRRVHWNNRGCKSIVWRCCSRLEATGHACHARTVNEVLLKEVAIEAINQVLCKKDDFLNTLQTNIATVIKQGDTLSPEVIDERLPELQKELVKKANQKDDYDAIADEILRLRDMRKQAEVDTVVKDEQMRLIQDLQDFIRQQPTTITEFDETLVKRLIMKITVFEDHFTVEFKSGITIDIEA